MKKLLLLAAVRRQIRLTHSPVVRGRLRAFEARVMAAALALFAICGSPTSAHAADGPRKPVVCSSYEIIRGKHRVIAICTDGKRPRVLVRFREVEIDVAENDTDVRKVLIGYTSVTQ